MKKTIKVFIVIHMVIGFFLFYPFFYGFHALEKINKAILKKELVFTGILSMFLISPVVGIMILCMKEEHLFTDTTVDLNSLKTDREKEMLDRTQEPYSSRPIRNCHLKNIGRGR